MIFTKKEIWEKVKEVAPKYSFDPYLIMAIICQESARVEDGFDASAARLEQGFYGKYVRRFNLPTTVEVLLSASYGIPQMMGQSLNELGYFVQYAEKHGFKDPYSLTRVGDAIDAFCVDLNLQVTLTCSWLNRKRKFTNSPEEWKWLLAWNGGGNQNYPDMVLAKKEILKKELSI